MGAWVEHSGQGTLVHQTSREDRGLVATLKAAGFRWSRRLEAWYLPRSWGEETRWGWVAQVVAEHPDVTVERGPAGAESVAVREERQRDRAAARAVRLDERADRAEREAAASEARSREVTDRIPLGQPVLVGHHSQRRHERDLERSRRALRASVEATERAEAARDGADRARRVAEGQIALSTLVNRIQSVEAELRQVARRLEGTGSSLHGEHAAASGAWREQLLARRTELRERLAYDQALLAERGGIRFGRENVKVGDLVKTSGLWCPVVRANVKSVTIRNPNFDAASRYTQSVPWQKVNDHVALDAATRGRVLSIAASTSSAFPGLRAQLEAIAAELPETRD